MKKYGVKCMKLYVSLRVWELAQMYGRAQANVAKPTSFEEILFMNRQKWESVGGR